MRAGAESAVGAGIARIEGVDKVTGAARYSHEYQVAGAVHAWAVTSDIARGRVTRVDDADALAQAGVIAVLTSDNVPPIAERDGDLAVLQSPRVAFHGQIVAAVVAETSEAAREAAALVRVAYQEEEHDALLREDAPGIYEPDSVNGGFPGRREKGDVDAGLAEAPVRIDVTYATPPEHAAPMEPHAAVAAWDGDVLTLHDSNQGPFRAAQRMAALFDVPVENIRVISDHIGGGFGSKALVRPPTVLAALAARAVGRPVKVALTRQQMFTLVSHRTPTVQRVRIGAERDGRLRALWHDALQRSSRLTEYCEQTTTPTRAMYATPALRTTHRLARLDVPTPGWVRAPGEAPGMFALESAMDELAYALDLDPIELRVRNEPEVEPDSGRAFSSRNLVACLRDGARRFGWDATRDRTPGARREGPWLVGTGVAAARYPVHIMPSTASARAEPEGRFTVRIAAVDIGTGARTALTQLAAEALGAPFDRVTLELGRSAYGCAEFAGGSAGINSWGWAVDKACRALTAELGRRGGAVGPDGVEVAADTADDVAALPDLARHAFGAQFAEVRVDAVTGQVRVERLLGVFAAGRVVNARTARSQLVGAMIMGLSTALHEVLELDPRFGDFANHDLATYHIAAHADVRGIEAHVLPEEDERVNPLGTKGIGELGIVGAAAAIGNAVHHATGVRVRELPILMERVRAGLGAGRS
ncbi:xanthine dehydrogenase family protein molybdopterin-binding subunit [Streptomyces sp. PT12]|uniref:xanthine dehydrogenase family protein molybdopterin-binding subunit n=1 Tax=Streptomyces sp. PT12 TaxID=1510197 RepID=UPI000DE41F76|nr:xanthine dehydrogenase family protein molybdopterin-binding subunit [Streptomyces sp. PT12]RBM04712.1 xanthine dehydrogenase [Streptomyces sp. PT12]